MTLLHCLIVGLALPIPHLQGQAAGCWDGRMVWASTGLLLAESLERGIWPACFILYEMTTTDASLESAMSTQGKNVCKALCRC